MTNQIAYLEPEMLEQIVRSANIAQNMNECLWVGDRQHRTLYVNPVFQKLSGYTLEEAVNKDCIFFFDEEGKRIIEKHHRLRNQGKSSQYEANLVTKKGKKIPLLISGAPTKTGGTIGIFTNLSKLKKLARQEKIASQIIKNSTEAIVVLDKNRKIKLWNTGATKIFGHKEKEVLNKNISLLIPESEKETNQKINENVKKNAYIKNFETKRLAKNKELIDVSLSITKVTDENKQFIGYLVIYRDITERKKFNTELQKRFETIQDAYKELGLQKRQADYIYDITTHATGKNSLESLGKLILSAICMLTKADGAILRLVDSQRKNLKMLAHFGVNDKWLAKSQIPISNSLAESAFKNRRPIIINSIDSSAKHKSLNLVKMHEFKTLILVPLVFENKLIGTISLYSQDPERFRLIETDFLENFSQQCTLALYAKKISEAPAQN